MKIILFGAAGFIGTNLILKLAKNPRPIQSHPMVYRK